MPPAAHLLFRADTHQAHRFGKAKFVVFRGQHRVGASFPDAPHERQQAQAAQVDHALELVFVVYRGAGGREQRHQRRPQRSAIQRAAFGRARKAPAAHRRGRHPAFVEQRHPGRAHDKLRNIRIPFHDRVQHVVSKLRIARGDRQREDIGVFQHACRHRRHDFDAEVLHHKVAQRAACQDIGEGFGHLFGGRGVVGTHIRLQGVGDRHGKGRGRPILRPVGEPRPGAQDAAGQRRQYRQQPPQPPGGAQQVARQDAEVNAGVFIVHGTRLPSCRISSAHNRMSRNGHSRIHSHIRPRPAEGRSPYR